MRYRDYLEEQLNICKSELEFDDVRIIVAEERIMNEDPDAIQFIIKNLTGSYALGGIKNQPIQIIVYSELNTFKIAEQILDRFALAHQNESFYEGNTLIKQTYNTPVALRVFIPSDTGYKASFYCYGQYTECKNLSDIKELRFVKTESGQLEYVDYISAGLSYSAVLNTTKERGQELSTSEKQEAGLVLTLSLMNNTKVLCDKINKVMVGELPGNTTFDFKFKWSWEADGTQYHNLSLKLSQASFSTDRVNIPGLEATFNM